MSSTGKVTRLRTSALRWSSRLFLIVGLLALGYVAFVFIDARIYQASQTRSFNEALNSVRPSIGPAISVPPVSNEALLQKVDTFGTVGREGFPLGQLEINSIGLTSMILEGTSDEILRRAVGHISGTALPGQAGNVALAAHRDTFFRPLGFIQKDAEITLTTLSGSYRYRVDSTKIVQPDDVGVLDDSGGAFLTLVTCYPFYFVGSAPQRFIVRAHRTSP